ncbi:MULTISPECIES: SHOCT domain-containing protein [unclassified Streptomyces]|uniref:SHOCT domain-containing protein n=1 Tax=unclassified Streptomyces TaxID=2593676 RepID=UPI0003620434|nr:MULTISPECIES: SHOCT domain-containing protein [unclassified Streptomyces]MYX35600.1 SHOCT domain-containing protein [Streptomyces sp. SID8377]
MTGHMYLAYDYPVLGAFWTMMWIFLWAIWIFLIVRVVMDVFRDDAMNGWAKAAWLLFVLVLPFIGILAYLLFRGSGMGRREAEQMRNRQKAFDEYVRETAGGGTAAGGVDALAKLSELKAKGDLTEEEFQRFKEKVLR